MMLTNEEIEGIYYSKKTGRMFETVRDGHGCVIIRYCDDLKPEFGACMREEGFRLQFCVLDFYEIVINYAHEEI